MDVHVHYLTPNFLLLSARIVTKVLILLPSSNLEFALHAPSNSLTDAIDG